MLRLVAQGYDTAEVAERLAYSESTIKGVLHGVMSRLDARKELLARVDRFLAGQKPVTA